MIRHLDIPTNHCTFCGNGIMVYIWLEIYVCDNCKKLSIIRPWDVIKTF